MPLLVLPRVLPRVLELRKTPLCRRYLDPFHQVLLERGVPL
jgi:hypothetical protein